MKIRKALQFISTPIRWIISLFNRWVNASNMMSAEWIRRYRLEKLIETVRKNG